MRLSCWNNGLNTRFPDGRRYAQLNPADRRRTATLLETRVAVAASFRDPWGQDCRGD